jgi:myo-inositol-1(or 4)-monophosphatase
MTDLKSISAEVERIAREAGAYILEEAGRISRSDIEVKGLHDFVTYVDQQAERMIVERLQPLIPEAGFIVEENTIRREGKSHRWVVDPLDGTTNFIHGIPVFSVSIALMQDSEVVLGTVYEPNRGECFSAMAGQGSFLNGERIHVSRPPSLRDGLIATGFPYHDYSRMEPFLKMFRWCMENTHGLRRLGSAAVDLAYVACGRFDAFFEYSLNPWDVAAGSLIVREAGGKVSDFGGGGNYLFGGEIVAAGPSLYHAFLTQIRDQFKKA